MSPAGRSAGVVSAHRIEVEFDATHLADAAAVVPTVDLIGVRRVGFDVAGAFEGIYG